MSVADVYDQVISYSRESPVITRYSENYQGDRDLFYIKKEKAWCVKLYYSVHTMEDYLIWKNFDETYIMRNVGKC